jgi:hypothetical protein
MGVNIAVSNDLTGIAMAGTSIHAWLAAQLTQ